MAIDPELARRFAELIASKGLNQQEAADLISEGMSTRMIRYILKGEKGEKYEDKIRDLVTRGETVPAPQRRTKAGKLVEVRAKGGGTTKPGRRTNPRPTLTSKGKVYTPAPDNKEIRDAVRKSAQGRRHVTVTIKTKQGRYLTLYSKGGISGSSLLKRIGQDGLTVLVADAHAARYNELEEDDIAEIVVATL
jgi:hypothetical protein